MNENKKWVTYYFIMIPKNNQKSFSLLYGVNWQNLKKQTRNSNVPSEITPSSDKKIQRMKNYWEREK